VGNKDNFYPHQKLLVSENNWVSAFEFQMTGLTS
jgi:hypothetical protein